MIVKRNIQSEEISQTLSEILYRIHLYGPVSQDDFETLAYIKRYYPDEFAIFEKQIIFTSGLFYKAEGPDGIIDLAYSTIKESIKQKTQQYYTPIQAKEYKEIQDHKYYSFSAPTSTGKSFLFQDLIKNETKDVVIVLPSRALIAEYYCKIQSIVPNDVLVLQFVDVVNQKHTKRRVFIITPERSDDLFAYKNHLDVGLILFDEAQLSEEEIRGLRFDSMVRKTIHLFPNAKKIFAHPFVSNPEAQLQRNFIADDCCYNIFNQNSVGKIYITRDENNIFETFTPFHIDEQGFFLNDIIEEAIENGKSILFYVSKASLYSDKFIDKYNKYIRLCDNITNKDGIRIIKTIHQYIGDSNSEDKQSRLLSFMKKGIVIHHGSMPLRIRLLIEEFVRLKCAKLCFATSTLIQGINMPFDVVCVDNFKFSGTDSKKILDLKNLIGRAGRTTETANQFDIGYVIIPKEHKKVFAERINGSAELSFESRLNSPISEISEDNKDIVEAIRNDAFDFDLRITILQKDRITQSDIFTDVQFILDNIIKNRNKIITTDEYYNLTNNVRTKIKQSFGRIYSIHLRRQELTRNEKSILSTAIPIILWRVQGKSFKEIIALRHSYITRKSERASIKADWKKGLISEADYEKQIASIKLKESPIARTIPNSSIKRVLLFGTDSKFDYDTLIYDTYDYIDKVIGQSLTDPMCAVLKLYSESTNDYRGLVLANYIRYGTNNDKYIMLMRYGFSMDDMNWLMPCIDSVNQDEIAFNNGIEELDISKKSLIERYLH